MNSNEFVTTQSAPAETGLVDGPRLLEILFPDEACRPSLRWLADQRKRRLVPFVRLGRLIFYSVPQVRQANERATIQPRGSRRVTA